MAGNTQHQKTGTRWQTERLNPHDVPWHKKRLLDEHLVRYLFACNYVKNKQVADVACGTGYGCVEMIRMGAKHVTGVDNSEEAIAYAREHFHDQRIIYTLSDACDTGLADNSIDVVTSFETLEHLKDTKAFLREIRRVLKPGGIFIVSTPNKELSTGTNPFHVKEYTFTECVELLKSFKIIGRYGQRKVFKPLSTLPFRPWEDVSIQPISSDTGTDFVYFIFVCRI